MNRALLIAALGLLGSGCYVSNTPNPPTPPPTPDPPQPGAYDVAFYWNFQRHKLDGSSVVYDAALIPGGASRACTQAGVDTVDFTELNGAVIDSSLLNIPCVNSGYQGVSISMFPGNYSWLITGRRGAHALYQVRHDFTVYANGANSESVTIPGIPDDLDIYAHFYDWSGTYRFGSSCDSANVQAIVYTLKDRANTTVDSQSIPCANLTLSAGVAFRVAQGTGIDRDEYFIRIEAFRNGVADFDNAKTPACTVQTFMHYGNDVGNAGWDEKLYDIPANSPVCP